ncbi:hypothetical protein [Rummeliibacillus pycnus]|uniref:hypothetical protein n=1 Tax=Rummeliibacillus pycnus TaxID=101070 RepID=UPI0037C58986
MHKVTKTVAAIMLGATLLTTTIAQSPIAEAKTTIKKVTKNVKIKSKKLVSTKTGKAVSGYALYKSKLYKNGKLFTGIVEITTNKNGFKVTEKKYYQNGKLFTGLTKDNTYYKKGVEASGLYKGYYYRYGKIFTGTNHKYNTYYKNGKPFTGLSGDNYYVNGVYATGFYKDYYYKNGYLLTGNLEGIYYDKGKVANGYYKDINTVYKNGVKNVGINRFYGEYFDGQNYYIGIYTEDDKSIYVIAGAGYNLDSIDKMLHYSDVDLAYAQNSFLKFSGNLDNVAGDINVIEDTLAEIKWAVDERYRAAIVAIGLNESEKKVQIQLTEAQELLAKVNDKCSIVIENMKAREYKEDKITDKEKSFDKYLTDINMMLTNTEDVLKNGITDSNTSYYSLNPADY